MNQMRKLATKEDIQASVDPLFTHDEIVQRQKENEVRVLEVAIQLFPYEDKYQIRLEKINSI